MSIDIIKQQTKDLIDQTISVLAIAEMNIRLS